jgi:hypothetical protein
MDDPLASKTVCPTCLRKAEGIIEGELVVHGQWDLAQRGEICNLVRAVEAAALKKNPTHRVIWLAESPTLISLSTSTDFLARHLARRLVRAYKGRREVHQAPGERFVKIDVWL